MTCVFLQSALNKFQVETAVCVTADRAGADFPVYSAARAAVREPAARTAAARAFCGQCCAGCGAC